VNLYGFADNDAINSWDYLGQQAQDNQAMINAVHAEAMKQHKASEEEYMTVIKSANPTVTTPQWNGGRPYKPKMPREYGGFVCEKCTKEGAALKYSYYLTIKKGPWPMTSSSASISLGMPPPCNGDKEVAYWHTHPSNLVAVEKDKKARKKQYKYYWAGDGGFSTKDTTMTLPLPLPQFVTYRSAPSYREWTYKTDRHPGGTVKESPPQAIEWIEGVNP
jgi:hypothetical protein